MTTPSVLITGKSITITMDGKTHSVLPSDLHYKRIRELIFEESWQEIKDLLDVSDKAEAVEAHVENETLIHTDSGKPAHTTLEARLFTETKPALAAFHANCKKNPRPAAVSGLLDFLRHKDLCLTPKGSFLAWKSVNGSYKDHHSGRFDNHIGQSPSMPFDACDQNRGHDCSTGFHVGAWAYTSGFHTSGHHHIMIAEVFPEHVTSVPYDSACQKLRCCTYKVIGEYSEHKIEATPEIKQDTIPEHLREIPKTAHINPGAYLRAFCEAYFSGKPMKSTSKTPAENEKQPKAAKTSPTKDTPTKTTSDEKAYTKKEVMEYVFQLKKSKKGDGYVARMVENKFPGGIEVLTDIAENPKNPSRINSATREVFRKVLAAK
jgi:hypothetical protein